MKDNDKNENIVKKTQYILSDNHPLWHYARSQNLSKSSGEKNKRTDNGYDYLDNDVMAIWLETEDAAENVERVIKLIESEEILENDLTKAATVYISEDDSAELDQCRKVYPEN